MVTLRLVRFLTPMLAALLLIGCGKSHKTEMSADGGEGGGSSWPKQATLSASGLGQASEALRLADGELAADGDVSLQLAVQLSLKSPLDDAESFCQKGTFAALADVPVDELSCPGSSADRWEGRLFLSGATFHTNEESDVIGLSALVRSASLETVYRLRVLGDAVAANAEGSIGTGTVTFEYEPVSAE